MKPIVISTIADYHREGYTARAHCWKCVTSAAADLAALVASGLGRTPFAHYRPTCQKCGERLQFVIQPPAKDGLLNDGRPVANRSVPTMEGKKP